MKLVIVESPTKVKTISKYLGKEYKVMASYGHIRDLAMKGEHNLGVDIANNFTPMYEEYGKSKLNIMRLKSAAKNSEVVYLATDPDREGEAISWHLAEVLNLNVETTPRLEFNEITPYGIENAMKAPRLIDMKLVHSQETRRIVDRIMGFELSTLLNKKIHSQSAGRVQSAVLKLICDRENEIKAFTPVEYWNIHVTFQDQDLKHKSLLVKVDGQEPHISTQKEAESLIQSFNKSVKVNNIVNEEKDYFPAPPFTTSSLQQEAYYALGFSTKKTMKVAQELYEGVKTPKGNIGVITYMRTDSYRLSPLFISAAKKQIVQLFGEEYVGKAYVQKGADNVQNAHEGIRPTYADIQPKDLVNLVTKDQLALYKLIYGRAVSSMMKPRHQINTTITLVDGNKELELKGGKITFLGFNALYNPRHLKMEDFDYKFKQGDELEILDILKEQMFTKPPVRFNEARLVKLMEELGIGRPSTYASTIETLRKREYITDKKNVGIEPTPQGIKTSERLSEFFAPLVDSKYTAALELQLDQIATGKQKELDLLQNFADNFYSQINFAVAHMNAEVKEDKKVGQNCPLCGNPLVHKHGKYGEFIGCSNYPDCNYIQKEETAPLEGEGDLCPVCGKGHLVKRKSKYGYFLACDQYPTCKYIKQDGKKRGQIKSKKIFKSKKKIA